MLVSSYGHTSHFKQPLPPDFAPVMGASLLPHKRVPIAVPIALMHRSLIPKLADADTVPDFWICLIIARIPKLVCALLAPKARDRKTPSVICKTQQDMNSRNLVWNTLIEMGKRLYIALHPGEHRPSNLVAYNVQAWLLVEIILLLGQSRVCQKW